MNNQPQKTQIIDCAISGDNPKICRIRVMQSGDAFTLELSFRADGARDDVLRGLQQKGMLPDAASIETSDQNIKTKEAQLFPATAIIKNIPAANLKKIVSNSLSLGKVPFVDSGKILIPLRSIGVTVPGK